MFSLVLLWLQYAQLHIVLKNLYCFKVKSLMVYSQVEFIGRFAVPAYSGGRGKLFPDDAVERARDFDASFT